jgi:glycosyltransferase involved in cell wall biosynthesis
MRVAFWLLQDSLHQVNRWMAGFYYVRHCLAALASLPRGEAPTAVAFVPESLSENLVDAELAGSTGWLKMVRVADELLSDSESRHDLERMVAGYPCDVSFPWLSVPIVPIAGRLIGWIPDYQHRRLPEFFSDQERAFRDALFRFLIGVCDRIVCSSDAVRDDLRAFFPEVDGRDSVLRFTASAPATVYESDPRAAARRLGIDRPYIYLPNQFWVHKNHRVVFEAWRNLKRKGRRYLLVCTGATDDYRAPGHYEKLKGFLDRHDLNEDVRILGLVDRRDQWQLYRGAKAVLQPSLFEGWSTTIEEAKSLGKPVIVSDIPTHREQMGQEGTYFTKDDVGGLAQAIDAIWLESSDGFDAAQEAAAREISHERVRSFGRDLVSLFDETTWRPARAVLPSVLPLLLNSQDECRKRLEVIEGLSRAANERLELVNRATAAAEERLKVIHTLDRACAQRSAQIAKLEKQLRSRA